MILCLFEDPSREALLYENCSRSVFIFIKLWFALSLNSKQSTRDRRPSENSGICKMKHIMEAIIIRLHMIIRQPISDEHPIAFLKHKLCASYLSFVDLHANFARNLLIDV